MALAMQVITPLIGGRGLGHQVFDAINIASTFAFFSIIMTSFGVNYYLTGLHSYATGDPVPIPKFVYVVTGILLLIAFFSSYKNVSRSKAARLLRQLEKK